MKRRLYFLLPDSGHTRAVVNDLEVFGINTRAMHVLAKPGVSLDGLPVATGRQRTDAGAKLETILWDGNLAIYFIALLTLVAMVYMGFGWFWLLLPVVIMVVTFLMGIGGLPTDAYKLVQLIDTYQLHETARLASVLRDIESGLQAFVM